MAYSVGDIHWVFRVPVVCPGGFQAEVLVALTVAVVLTGTKITMWPPS